MKEVEILSLLWSEKNFLFFVKRETKRRKKQKWQPKTKKFKNFALFALFLRFGQETETPTKLGHVHTHRCYINFFSLKISLCFVR